MKKSFVNVTFFILFIIIIILFSTTLFYKIKNDKQQFEVYLFQGEDSNIRISSGLIIITPNKHIVSGGNIQFIGDIQEKMQSYSKTIYFKENNNKNTILSNSVSYEGDTEGMSLTEEFDLNKEVGGISSDKLFSEADINAFKDNLYFSLDYSTFDGKERNFTIKLIIEKMN